MIRIAFLICSILLLAACNPPTNDSESHDSQDPLVLEVYPASTGMAGQIESALAYLLAGSARENRTGIVTVLPNGHIAVSAPASMQPGIAALIEQIAESEPEPPSQVRIRQWLVEATPAKNVMIPDNLASLEKPLTNTTALTGPLSFKRLEQVEFRVLEGRQGRINGKMLDVSAQARQIVSDTILLRMQIRSRPTGSYLETDMSVNSGERVVMGMVENREQEAMLMLVLEAEIL